MPRRRGRRECERATICEGGGGVQYGRRGKEEMAGKTWQEEEARRGEARTSIPMNEIPLHHAILRLYLVGPGTR